MPFRCGIAPIAVISLLAATASGATAAEIYPTSLILERNEPVTTLRIRNDEATRKSFELTGLSWRQDDGEDVYAPDDGLIVTPPLLTLEPGEEAVIRIGLIAVEETDPRERAYRLLIDDITAPQQAPANALTVRVQILLPVFLAAAAPGPSMRIFAGVGEDGQFCVTGRNDGESHAKMVWLANAQAPERKIPTHQYFLAGAGARMCSDALPPDFASRPIIAGLTSAYQHSVTHHEIQTMHNLPTLSPGE